MSNEHVAEPFRSILDSVVPKAGGGAGGPSRSLHTPVPWRLPRKAEEFVAACVVREDGFLVADCNVIGAPGPSDEECMANARFIILAVNSHADLLAACKAALRFIGGTGSTGKTERDALRAAIRIAEGGAA